MEEIAKPRIVITCMDYRMNGELEHFFHDSLAENTYVLRTAGGRLNRTLANEIIALDPGRITWLPHTDCGALKFAHNAINGQSIFPMSPITNQTARILKEALRDNTNHSSESITLEQFVAIQVVQGEKRLRKEFKDTSFITELVDVSGIGKQGNTPSVLIVSENMKLSPSAIIFGAVNEMRKRESGFNSENTKFYILQVPKVSLVDHDIELATKALKIPLIIFQRNVEKIQVEKVQMPKTVRGF